MFAGKTVFITGHSGFIGAWLCTVLAHQGATVVGYSVSDDPDTRAREEWLGELGITQLRGDVRDSAAMWGAMRLMEPDITFHLAAQALLCRGFDEPHATFDVNLNGSLNVLEAARMGLTGALVHVTSDKCYVPMEDAAQVLTETSPLGGHTPYPSSKAIAEMLFAEFARMTRFDGAANRLVSVRLGNVIGGGDWADRLVPNCLRAFQEGREFSLRDPAAVRPYQHVLDVVAGLVLLGERLLGAEAELVDALNFAPPTLGHACSEMVEELARAWGPDARLGVECEASAFPEDKFLVLDGSRAAAMLGWRHRFGLAQSADRIVEWVRMVEAGATPAEATHRQVVDYYAARVATKAEAA